MLNHIILFYILLYFIIGIYFYNTYHYYYCIIFIIIVTLCTGNYGILLALYSHELDGRDLDDVAAVEPVATLGGELPSEALSKEDKKKQQKVAVSPHTNLTFPTKLTSTNLTEIHQHYACRPITFAPWANLTKQWLAVCLVLSHAFLCRRGLQSNANI